MSYKYATPDGEKFLRKLPARQHIAEKEDLPHREAEELVEEIDEPEKEDEEMVTMYEFRFEEFWKAVRSIKVKAPDKDIAREIAEEKIMELATELTHKVHTEMEKLGEAEEVPLREVETGEYWEEGGSS